MAQLRTTPAVFLDRDGTIIEDRGHLRIPSEVVFFRNSIRALKLLQRTFRLFIVTNQPGIAEGILGSAEVAQVHEFILNHLARFGICIDQVYCCSHRRSDGCRCIKPNPYYLRRAARQHGIDLQSSFVVGDHPHDVELAKNSGATGIFVLTGHGTKHSADLPADALVVNDIWEAATLIAEITSFKRSRREPGARIVRAVKRTVVVSNKK